MVQGVAGLAIGARPQPHAAETIPGREIAWVGGDHTAIGVCRCVDLAGQMQRISRLNVRHLARITHERIAFVRADAPSNVDSDALMSPSQWRIFHALLDREPLARS